MSSALSTTRLVYNVHHAQIETSDECARSPARIGRQLMNPRSIDGLKIAMVAAVGGCAMAIAAVAIGHGLSSWTETGGGTPAPPRPPRAAVKLFNTDTTKT